MKILNASKYRDTIVRWKFRIGYFSGFLTTFAAIIIIANTLQEKISLLGINLHYTIVLVAVLLGVFVGAYLFDRFGFIESEVTYANSKNKLLKEIHGGK